MATQYTGDRTAVEMPASKPNDGVSPIGVVPDDGDDLNASSVLQIAKVALDFLDYCTHRFEDFPGVRSYDAARTYTEGMMCLDIDGMTYRVKTGQSSIGIHPYDNGTKWERWGYSATELAAAFVLAGDATAGQLTLPGGFRILWQRLDGTQLPNESTPSVSHTFWNPFPTTCFVAFFQATSYSAAVDAPPQVLVGVTDRTAVSLGRPANASAAGSSVATGYLLAIGN